MPKIEAHDTNRPELCQQNLLGQMSLPYINGGVPFLSCYKNAMSVMRKWVGIRSQNVSERSADVAGGTMAHKGCP